MHCVSDIPDWTVVESVGLAAYDFSSFAPLSPADRDKMDACSPIRYVANVTTPTLLCIGAKDRRVPPSQGMQYYHILKAQGCVVDIRVYPLDDHAIDKPASEADQFLTIRNWLQTHLV